MGDLSLITGSGRSPGDENGYPLQYSCLENSMNRGSWRATGHSHKELNMTEGLELSHSFSLKITLPISAWIKTVWLQNLLPSLLTVSLCLVSRRNEKGRDGRCSLRKNNRACSERKQEVICSRTHTEGKRTEGKKGEISKQSWRSFGDSVDEAMPGCLTART